ncbi:STAS domain-containing protein [Actinacidiphila guanduensis]|uniref:Anti-sigma factor antagonist n=1 Tax=Actinacidiphila guanduensis TaxID=310781 RepID=A0A1H0F8V2_9ACTN|nr:STAS domain-containing protein [Actinacidiphila guanduensis]SDN90969.1 anti-anti-sigma factor [Actinacidiphila guanduensis]
MQVTRTEQDGWAVVAVAGEMDLLTSSAVREKVHEAVADGRRSLVLDLADVRFCDSSGVGVLIGARRLMRSCAGRLRIVLPEDDADRGAGSHVNRVLAALGVRRLFEVYPDLEAATDESARPLSA